MDDADLVAIVASDYVRRQGRRAIDHLRDKEAFAEQAGDMLSAEAWGDIAETAEAILLHSN
jgi:hypothetical protein